MHLLATASGSIDGGAEPMDLAQSPADIVVLTAADSEISHSNGVMVEAWLEAAKAPKIKRIRRMKVMILRDCKEMPAQDRIGGPVDPSLTNWGIGP